MSDVLEGIRQRLSNVKEKNGELWASCPLGHRDNNPSFSINLDEGIFYCFSCQESGTINQLAVKMGLKEEGNYMPSVRPKQKSKVIKPYQRVKNIKQAADMLEDHYLEDYRKARNKIELDWNERRISEPEYYRKRQMLDYKFDYKMGKHGELRNRLTYEAKRGGKGIARA